jgi:WD40 repeat protein
VRVWDLAHGGTPITIDAGFPVAALAVSADGKVLATAGEDQPIRVWDRSTGKLVRQLGEKSQSALALAFSPDGALLVAGYKNGTAGLWTADGAKRGLLRGHRDRVWSVAFSPDGATIATASLDGTVRLWDTATRLPVATLPRPLAHGVAFSRDGKLLATVGADPAVQLLELADRRKLRPARADLEILQKKYGLRLVGVDVVELEPR